MKDKKKYKLALIGAGKMAWNVAKRAKEIGVETHCFAWEQGALAKEYADYFYPISIMEKDKILEECMKLHVDGVLGPSTLSLPTAAYISEKLGLNGNSVEFTARALDKYNNRRSCDGLKYLHNPRYDVVYSLEELKQKFPSFPYILKPTTRGGKLGITVVRQSSDLAEAWRYADENRKPGEGVIAEEFLEGGMECSVECISYHGTHYMIQITRKETTGAPHCVEIGDHQPAPLSESKKELVRNAVTEGLDAIGLKNGASHTEIKIIGDTVYLIEINPRAGGDPIAYPMTELSTGYPYITGMIQVALNTFEPPDVSKFEKHYVGEYDLTEQTRWLKDIFDTCESEPWCYERQNKTGQVINAKTTAEVTNWIIYYDDDGDPIERLMHNKMIEKGV